MKSFAILCAALLVAGIAASASAGEHAVSKSTLAAMGFASAQPMSDIDGGAVRGKGWWPSYGTSASVGGTSTTTFYGTNGSGSTATNWYDASSNHKFGSALAKGEGNSFAGTELTKSWGSNTFIKTFYVVSGGSSFAFAK